MDSSIYGAMIRLSQDWVMRYPLIDVHGNNGTILGDGPAAGRYTEARLSKIAEDGLLFGLKKKNVDFTPNYDESEDEPVTLPSIFPNLLCNPNEGIGWAMGCSWAPHNLREVKDAIIAYLNSEEPMLPGPDFPTGGIVINKNDIPEIMRTGRGSVKIRGKYKVDGNNITFYEIPYGTRIEPLMEEIGAACDEGSITGIAEVRNETGKIGGVKLTIQVEKNANIKFVINELFSKTNLQTTFSYNQVALIGKTPTELNLKDAIKVYVEHNIDCIVRETKFDLDKAAARKEIVDGLLRALEDIDNIIKLIKASSSAATAKESLIAKYNFTDNQAKAIIDMKLGKLANLEKVELQNECAELEKLIQDLTILMNSRDAQTAELIKRLNTIVEKYGDARRTELIQIDAPKGEEKEIANVEPEKCVVIMTKDGAIKRVPITSFRTQKRNGKGVKTLGDITTATIRTNTIDSLMVFTNKGKMYRILVNDIPEGTNSTKGQPIKSLIEMDNDEEPTLIYSIYRDTDAKYVLFTTKNGLVKKTSLEEYVGTARRKIGLSAIKIKEDDALASVDLIKDEDIILTTVNGMGIRIHSTGIAASSRTTIGVKGISLKEGDYVINTLVVRDENDDIAVFDKRGNGKRVLSKELPAQNKGGKGLALTKSLPVTSSLLVNNDDNILIVGTNNSICISATDIPIQNRAAIGNIMIKGDIISTTKV